MELRFSGAVWYCRGPAPFHFVTVPSAEDVDDVVEVELQLAVWLRRAVRPRLA